jgi:hypothetical protein
MAVVILREVFFSTRFATMMVSGQQAPFSRPALEHSPCLKSLQCFRPSITG